MIRVLGGAAGLLLLVIGVRFLVVPEGAAFTFGLSRPPKGQELHHMVGLRDLWLAGLAIAFAALKEWRALALWLLMGAAVCFADAWIVSGSSARWWAIAFHILSGVFCLWLGARCWSYARRL